jgi:actin-related protein
MSLFANFGAPIIIESNSSTVIAGFAGEARPSAVFSCALGRFRSTNGGGNYPWVGDEIFAFPPEDIEVAYPIVDGVVSNFEEVERLYNYALYDALKVEPEEHPVLLIEPPFNPIASRHRMTRLFFDSFRVPAFALVNNAELALYATGRQTGLVIFSEYHQTWIVPVHEGKKLKNGALSLSMGRRDVLRRLAQLLENLGHSLENKVLEDILQKHAYVAPSYSGAPETTVEYEAPDGQLITLSNELSEAPEILFRPNLAGKEHDGLCQLIFEVVGRCAPQLHGTLYGNIVLAGDNTLYPGMAERLKQDLADLVPNYPIQVICPENRAQLAFLGAQMLAGTPAFEQMYITAQEFSEFEDSVLEQKFPS